MDNSKENPNQIEILLKLAEEYGLTVLTLWKFKAADKVSDIVSSVIVGIGVFIILFMVLFMVTIGAALLIGSMLDCYWYGFFIVAGFYLMVAIILKIFAQKWLKKTIADNLIKNIFK